MSHTFFNWTGLDYIIAAILFLSLLTGLIRGFAKEVISLLAWVAAFYAALKFSSRVDVLLSSAIPHAVTRYVVSVVLIFFVVVLAGCLISKLIRSLLKLTGFGFFDRLLGLCFGFARGLLFVTIMLVAIAATPYQNSDTVKGSQLAPYYATAVAQVSAHLPKEIKALNTASAVMNHLVVLTHALRVRG